MLFRGAWNGTRSGAAGNIVDQIPRIRLSSASLPLSPFRSFLSLPSPALPAFGSMLMLMLMLPIPIRLSFLPSRFSIVVPPLPSSSSSSSSAACACLLRVVAAIMRWHRGQQLWLAVVSVMPGWLVYQQTVKPAYAALMLVFLYFLSKRHAFLVQRQFERDEHDRNGREVDEKQRLVSLPMRKRRAIERAKRRQEEEGASEANGSDRKDE